MDPEQSEIGTGAEPLVASGVAAFDIEEPQELRRRSRLSVPPPSPPDESQSQRRSSVRQSLRHRRRLGLKITTEHFQSDAMELDYGTASMMALSYMTFPLGLILNLIFGSDPDRFKPWSLVRQFSNADLNQGALWISVAIYALAVRSREEVPLNEVCDSASLKEMTTPLSEAIFPLWLMFGWHLHRAAIYVLRPRAAARRAAGSDEHDGSDDCFDADYLWALKREALDSRLAKAWQVPPESINDEGVPLLTPVHSALLSHLMQLSSMYFAPWATLMAGISFFVWKDVRAAFAAAGICVALMSLVKAVHLTRCIRCMLRLERERLSGGPFPSEPFDAEAYSTTRCFEAGVYIARIFRCMEVVALLEDLCKLCHLSQAMVSNADFWRKWQRIENLHIFLPMSGPSAGEDADGIDMSHLTREYKEALENRVIPVQELAVQFLLQVDPKAGIISKIMGVLNGARESMAIIMIVMTSMMPMIYRGGICKLENHASPLTIKLSAEFEMAFIDLVWVSTTIFSLYYIFMRNVNGFFHLACRIKDTHVALNDMLRGTTAAGRKLLPPVRVADSAALVAWIEVRGLFLASVSSQKAAHEMIFGFAMVTYILVLVAWVYFASLSSWTPGVLSAVAGCIVALAILLLPPALYLGLGINGAMARQLGLITSTNVDGQTCFAYADLGAEVTTAKLGKTESVSVREGNVKYKSATQARELSRALAINMQLDQRHIFCVLGIALTSSTLGSLGTAMGFAYSYIYNRVHGNLDGLVARLHNQTLG